MPKRVWAYAAVAASMTLTTALVAAFSSAQVFRVRDDCDPKTFNSGPPTGPGAGVLCNPDSNGGTTFARFIEELTDDQEVGAWRFNPDHVRLDRGQGTVLESRGGEFHTFTRVAAFGGGILTNLNDLAGAGETRPECGSPGTLAPPSATNFPVPDGTIQPGPTAGSDALPRGTSKWQCCIHPWMRSEIRVR
jgi:hypothetical protein